MSGAWLPETLAQSQAQRNQSIVIKSLLNSLKKVSLLVFGI